MSKPFSVLFVCLGNICRSPTAEGVFRQKVIDAGLSEQIHIDSAGTSAYHVGESPDPRSQQEASRHGYDLSTIRSRKVVAEDFEKFDLLIAMDESNLSNLCTLSKENPINSNDYQSKLKLFLHDYAPQLKQKNVPDPYYGGVKGFTEVVELIEVASDALLLDIQQQLKESNV